jgi:hypothetical protein
VKALNRNALTLLTAMDVPPKYRAGLHLQTPERDLPLRQPEMVSLRSLVMENMKDPRRSNRSFPFASMITFITMALLQGAAAARHLSEDQQQPDPIPQRRHAAPAQRGGRQHQRHHHHRSGGHPCSP